MDREDYILRKIYDVVLWVFVGLMVLCLCLAASKDSAKTKIIDELEQNIMVLEDHNDQYAQQIEDLNNEVESLNALLDSTKKQYEDRISELEAELEEEHQKVVQHASDESLYRSYKLSDGVYIN